MSNNQASNSNQNELLTQTQIEMNTLKEIMTENVEKVMERGHNLNELQESCENLEIQANMFNVKCKKVKRKMYFRNKKLQLCIALICLAIFLIFIGILLIYFLVIKK